MGKLKIMKSARRNKQRTLSVFHFARFVKYLLGAINLFSVRCDT